MHCAKKYTATDILASTNASFNLPEIPWQPANYNITNYIIQTNTLAHECKVFIPLLLLLRVFVESLPHRTYTMCVAARRRQRCSRGQTKLLRLYSIYYKTNLNAYRVQQIVCTQKAASIISLELRLIIFEHKSLLFMLNICKCARRCRRHTAAADAHSRKIRSMKNTNRLKIL